MRQAYERAGWSPADVDLIECHATGTPKGDAVEIESLKALWGAPGWTRGQCALGSIKSNIGHALTAAGAAGLLKVLLALEHGQLPPTANFERSAPRSGLNESPFRVLREAEPWRARAPGRPRRAAVSGFGFGGINAHVLIEEWLPRAGMAHSMPRGSRRSVTRDGQERAPIAVVGVAARFGALGDTRAFESLLLTGSERGDAVQPARSWGLDAASWLRQWGCDAGSLQGHFIDGLELRIDEFRIPPNELREMLPQQSLMLSVAAQAIRDARWDARLALRTGTLIGIGLDLNTTNYHWRWALASRARGWLRALRLALLREEIERWIDGLKDAASPALTANRTMGSLGGLIASRIAREFGIGGPSFTISCDETSGIQALAIAADWLRRGDLDAAVVGAVELTGDIRALWARRLLARNAAEAVAGRYCDGAVALVLKRLEDARRDQDRIYAVLGAIETYRAGGSHGREAGRASVVGDEPVGFLELNHFEPQAARCDGNSQRLVRGRVDRARSRSRGSGVGLGVGCQGGPLPRPAVDSGCCTRWSVGRRCCSNSRGWVRAARSPVLAAKSRRRPAPRGCVDCGLRRRLRSSGARGVRTRRERARSRSFAVAARAGSNAGPLRRRGRRPAWIDRAPDGAERAGRLVVERRPGRAGCASLRKRHHDRRLRRGLAIVADRCDALVRLIALAEKQVGGDGSAAERMAGDFARVYYDAREEPFADRVAFVYPGLGSHYAGMGRELATLWPGVMRDQDAPPAFCATSLIPRSGGTAPPRSFSDHRDPILGSVSVSCLVTDVLQTLGVTPQAAIGYSMGEAAALVALRAWNNRDELLHKLRSSSLFQTDLAGECAAARRAWQLSRDESVDWVAGVVPRAPGAVRAAIAGRKRVYALIVNSALETVIGGQRRCVEEVVEALGSTFIELPTVSTVHCEIGRMIEADYYALHDVETTPPAGIRFYSGVWARSYELDRRSAAAAITAQACQPVDFPSVINRAYDDGIRVFVEVGPGSSCTRLIDQILGQRPHLACAACRVERSALAQIFDVLGHLIARRVPVDLAGLYGTSTLEARAPSAVNRDRAPATLRIDVPGRNLIVPSPPSSTGPPAALDAREEGRTNGAAHGLDTTGEATKREASPLARALRDAGSATARAHEQFLRVSQGATALLGRQIALQLRLIEQLNGDTLLHEPTAVPVPVPVPAPVMFDRTQCLEFAVGSIEAVLGSDYAEIDEFPTRVRLPDEPLMLVDRIIAVEGRPRSLQPGRVVTEHSIARDAWYLDGGRIAPSIAIEAGQADLFLCGYLGVDLETRGLAVYRLLDATVTFHRGLPGPGAVIRYDIRITTFFRQGETILFRFEFGATVDGELLLTMKSGCAGFFTPEELAAGRGIVTHAGLAPPAAEPFTGDVPRLVPLSPGKLDSDQLTALRRGDLGAAFGAPFDRLPIDDVLPLPGGRMTLVHSVLALDPAGGPYGLGKIRAASEIHPGDWFMVCHFVDDRVMPGTLMYEACLHALRILLMRIGWIGRRGRAAYEPVPGIANRLKCRGQIVESTSRVTYEVVIKELGFRSEPYAIADAVICADGRAIVEITDMALQLSGTDQMGLERLWADAGAALAPRAPVPAADRAVLFDHRQILAFAIGNPSEGFGERYRPFDSGRFIARLPGPPYQFLHRVIEVDAQPWVMAAGGSALAEYDITPDTWYFAADRQDQVPFAVLLEVALQACGWLAAYMGSALTSDDDLKFRNLGGEARQHRLVTRASGTLATRVRVTRISSTAGMILQHYDYAISDRAGLVYDGSSEFGFFHPRALVQQVGIRDSSPYRIGAAELGRAESFAVPEGAPFPDRDWRMVDEIDTLVSDGGPHGLGMVRGGAVVDPDAWFFKAHFRDDPVWPGSLGLESLLQLLKIMAARRWGAGEHTVFESPALLDSHRWTYRGQIVPANRRVTVQALVKARDDREQRLVADGHLEVDGLLIYQMHDFSMRMRQE